LSVTTNDIRGEGGTVNGLYALDTLLNVGGTSRCCASTVGVIETFYTCLFREGTCLFGSCAVRIGVTDSCTGFGRCANVTMIGIAVSLGFSFFPSPLGNRAVTVGVTLNAATTVYLTARQTSIKTVLISSTEVYADTSLGITVGVRVCGGWGTIGSSSTCVAIDAAIITKSITSTVGCDSRAISIGLTTLTSSTGLITAWLLRNTSSISGIAEIIGGTSEARSILLTVVVGSSSKICLAASIVYSVDGRDSTAERINTDSVSSTFYVDVVGGRGTITGSTSSVIGTSYTSSVIVAVGGC